MLRAVMLIIALSFLSTFFEVNIPLYHKNRLNFKKKFKVDYIKCNLFEYIDNEVCKSWKILAVNFNKENKHHDS